VPPGGKNAELDPNKKKDNINDNIAGVIPQSLQLVAQATFANLG
jgi:hypothetical protein